MIKRPEVLSPAGDMEKLIMAVNYGADAVYLAGPAYGMRAGTSNFTYENMPQAVELAHSKGVKVYVTCNTIPTDDEAEALPEYLSFLDKIGVDALIIADVGVLSLCREYAPHCDIHISTQAGVMNSVTAKAFHKMGASRVVLAREVSLEGIRKLIEKLPDDLEVEVFCHGAMCVSFSGRCVLSSYLTGRDPNRGQCAQPCRWKYYLVEEKRPGEYMEISEDGGTYILNSRDMCMIEHVKEMMEAGITSLKIEGRTKSAYYVASTTAAYRNVVDAIMAGEEPDPVWIDEVNKSSHRAYSTGFFYGQPGQNTADTMYYADYDVMAVVDSCDDEGNAVMFQRNRFWPGDEVELLMPKGKPVSFTIGEMFDVNGEPVEVANKAAMELHAKLPVRAPKYSFLRKKRS